MASSVLEVSIPGKGSGSSGAPDPDAPRESVKERACRMATKAGQQRRGWQASYAELSEDIRSFYAEEISRLTRDINGQLGAHLNGLGWNLSKGTNSVLQQTKRKYTSLHSDALKYQRDRAEFNKRLEKERLVYPDLSEDDIRKTEIKTFGSWFLFFAILSFIVLLESAANMSLLAGAVEGGLVQAFWLATLVSVVNVMGVGAGVGFLCAFLFRKLRGVFYAALPLWLGGVVAFNLVVGQHREGYMLKIIKAEEQANAKSLSEGLGSLAAAPGQLAEAVSLNILSWHFESILFLLLGIVLSCLGFYKGISCIRPGEKLKPVLDELNALQEKVEQGIDAIASEGSNSLDELRKSVSDVLWNTDKIVRACEDCFYDMEAGWTSMFNLIRHEFVDSYNQANPGKQISAESIKETDIVVAFPASQPDKDAIDRGMQFIKNYETDQKSFFAVIDSANAEISREQDEHRQAVHSLMHDSRPLP